MPEFVQITGYFRPHQIETVKAAVAACEITGLHLGDARGCGNSPEATIQLGGSVMKHSLPIRCKLTVVVPAAQQEQIIAAMIGAARTGEHGDGKIFVEAIQDCIRIRTLERGETAV